MKTNFKKKAKIAFCISGLFTPSGAGNNAHENNYKYLLDRIKELKADVFIFSFSKGLESHITELFNPKLAVFEAQKDFSSEISKIDFPHDGNTAHKSFSYFYSRKRVCELKAQHESKNGKYDIVFWARPDLGYHNFGKDKVSFLPAEIPFVFPGKLYSCSWNQTNAGLCDHWFISDSDEADFMGAAYDRLDKYFKQSESYFRMATTGWPYSSENEFSQELSKIRPAHDWRLPVSKIVNNHYLIKYHLLENYKWNLNYLQFLEPFHEIV